MIKEENQLHWCEWSKKEGLLPKGIIWRRMNHKGNRYYFAKSENKIIVGCGITTAISQAFGESPFLRKWKDDTPNWKENLSIMADYGTLCHIGLVELVKDGFISESTLKLSDTMFNKKTQFKKDMLSLKKFLIDHKVEVHFLEGILGQAYTSPNGATSYLCSAIDMYCTMSYFEKNKVEVEDGVYVRGDKKGEIKYKEVTSVTETRIQAIVDLKSNYDEKEEKSFFDSHKSQLIFGRRCIASAFDVKKEDIRMFNLSPLGWNKEPKFVLKEHKIGVNEYGYSDEQLLDNRLNTALIEGAVQPKGMIFEIDDEIRMDNDQDYRILSYEQYAEEILNTL